MDSAEDDGNEMEQVTIAIEEMIASGIEGLTQDPRKIVKVGLFAKVQGPKGMSMVISLPGTMAVLPDEMAEEAVRQSHAAFEAMSLSDAETKH